MGMAVLTREVEWTTRRGRRLLVRTRRLASLADRHLVALDYEVVALDGPVAVTLVSELVTHAPPAASDDPRRGRDLGATLVGVSARAAGRRAVLSLATRESGLHLAVGMDHEVRYPASSTAAYASEHGAHVVFSADLQDGDAFAISKFVAYHWAAADADLETRVERTLDTAVGDGYHAVERAQRHAAAAFWDRCDVEVDGPAGVQGAVRFNLF